MSGRLSALLPFVLICFTANSLITRHVVGDGLLDAGLLTVIRFVAGAVALVTLTLARHERPAVGRANLMPALWLGVYGVGNAYGFRALGAAPGTFVFYATVLLTLVGNDVVRAVAVPRRRALGAGVSLVGIGVLASADSADVSLQGVLLLAGSGAAWGLYTAAGRQGDPRRATTGHFVLLAAVLAGPGAIGVATGLPLTWSGVLWAVALGAGTTAFGYIAWYACQRTLSGTAAGSVQLLIPILTAGGAVLLLDETISSRLLLAGAFVVAGMVLGRARPAPADRPVDG